MIRKSVKKQTSGKSNVNSKNSKKKSKNSKSKSSKNNKKTNNDFNTQLKKMLLDQLISKLK